MAERRGKKYPVMGVRTWRTLTLSFGLVNVKVAIQTMRDSSAKMGGHRYCAEHNHRVGMKNHCPECGECEVVVGYEVDGGIVTLTDSEAADLIPLDLEKRIELESSVAPDAIDPLYFDQTYNIWWAEDVYAPAYKMITEALRSTGKWLVGTTQLGRTTKVVVIRYSPATGTLLAHTLTHDAYVRWEGISGVREATEAVPLDDALIGQAVAVFDTMASDFNIAAIEDTYDDNLRAAIEAKASGLPAPAKAPEVGVEIPDLMAALKASLGASQVAA